MKATPTRRLHETIEQWTAASNRGDCILHRASGDVLRLLLADAAGHDENAARAIGFLRPLLERDLAFELSPRVYGRWSDAVHRRFSDEPMFVCFTAIELDRGSHRLTVANAGNPDLLVRRANGRVQRFPSSGMPLGIVAGHEWMPPTPQRTTLRDGDFAMCFSDGLVDRRGVNGDRFGLKRVCRAARTGGRRVLRVLQDVIARFSCAGEHHDDLSVLLVGLRTAA